MLIIKRINCINTSSGTCQSVSVCDTIDSPDDEHEVAQNMQRIEINTLKKLCVNLVIYHES